MATERVEIERSIRLAERMARLGTESAFDVLVRARALEAVGRDIIHLEIGEPDFSTPPHIVEAGIQALRAGETHYTPPVGIPALREAIAHHVNQSRGVEIGPDRVVVTPGGKPIMFFTILALAGPGDEVIYPDPGFPIYRSVIEFSGARPVPLRLEESRDFRYEPADLARLITDRTRLVIINSPHNPTGGVLGKTELLELARLTEKHDFYILSDEIYSRITYGEPPFSIISCPGMLERTILLDGCSKTYAMTGWRLGYGVVPTGLVDGFTRLVVNSNSCTPAFTQLAAVAALTGPQDAVDEMVAEFRQRRELVVSGLNAIPGISCRKPSGAFYAFPNVSAFGKPSDMIADLLLEEAGVAVLAGSAFGDAGEDHLRISYASSRENLERALDRMRSAFARLL